jgi:hypothetical protein
LKTRAGVLLAAAAASSSRQINIRRRCEPEKEIYSGRASTLYHNELGIPMEMMMMIVLNAF